MPSLNIHMAIAKKYLEKHKIENVNFYFRGVLYPDISSDEENNKAHYSHPDFLKNSVSYLRKKVDLYAFLRDHAVKDDFELGYFLHLVTDFLFFNECIEFVPLKNMNLKKLRNDLRFAYDCLDDYLISKYNITVDDYGIYSSAFFCSIHPCEECILSKEMIDHFIERVSSIDLYKYVDKIKFYKNNVKPN